MKNKWAVVFLTVSFPLLGQSGRPQTKPATQVLAKWDSVFSSFGLTEDDFRRYSLSRLTPDGLKGVLLDAWSAGYVDGSKTATPRCGPLATNTENTRVQVFVDSDTETGGQIPSELSSVFRQKLRSISDVQLVFKEGGADIIVSSLGLANESESGRLLGYTLAVVESRPCVVGVGENSFSLSMNMGHSMRTGSLEYVVNGIVADLDAGYFEQIRKWHAAAKASSAKPQ